MKIRVHFVGGPGDGESREVVPAADGQVPDTIEIRVENPASGVAPHQEYVRGQWSDLVDAWLFHYVPESPEPTEEAN